MLRAKFHSLQFQYSTAPMNAKLGKKDGGIRPIAVGSTIRRLSVKVGLRPVVLALEDELSRSSWRSQLVGDARRQIMRPDVMVGIVAHRTGLLKIDMRNEFNRLRRDSFLFVARVRTPGLYSLLWQAYSSPTRLIFVKDGSPQRHGGRK